MGFPRFRFTLNNTVAGSLVISEPGGWDEAVLKLERNQEFHSLVEFYDQPLTFYGQSSNGNGGLDYIREVENSQGPDAQITILIEISDDDGVTYTDTVFDGLIDITSCKEVDFYKAEYGIIRNDFWQKFINRKGTPVNLGAAVDVDGNAISSFTASTLTLTSQEIRQTFERRQDPAFADNISSVSFGTTNYLMWGNVNPVYDEITERIEYGTQVSSELPTTSEKYLFKFDYAGDYVIDLNIKYYINFGASRTYDLRWYYAYRVGGVFTGPTQIGSTISGTAIDVTWTVGSPHTLSTTLTFSEGGAELYIYGTLTLSSSGTGSYFPDFDNDAGAPFDPVYTTLTIEADTLYPDTTANGYQVLNAAKSIASKLTGSYPSVTSDYLLSSSGCGHNYVLTKGLYIRGYNTTDKPFYMSFDQWWGGLNPILNLGLGYINGADTIEIEQKSEFYDPVPVLNLDYVNMIERSWDDKMIFKSIEVGYDKWSAESGSGIDDPQTKHTYSTRFKTVGEDFRILSKFYAASLGIEQTRRNRVELGKDWRLDEDIMIIAVQEADNNLPELGNGPFSSVSGILNASSRYNLRITPARNLLRWKEFLNGCLKWYTDGDDLKFASGEGNYISVFTTLESTDCEYDLYDEGGLIGHQVGEAADFDSGSGHDFLFVPIVYEFEHPLTWDEYKAIQSYRKKAIGVSRSASDHVSCFIMSLEYQITKGKGKFTVLLGQSEPI